MGWVIALLISTCAQADTTGQFELSGYVAPTMAVWIKAKNDGFSLTNAGNEIALFQVGARNSSMQRVSQLSQGQAITLRTDYVEQQNGTGPVEIRIMAP